jgi:hypothetical protein
LGTDVTSQFGTYQPITLGYAPLIANQAGLGAGVEADVTGLSVTVTVPAGRRLRISTLALTQRTVGDGPTVTYIKEGGTYLQVMEVRQTIANIDESIGGSVIVSPTAGTHTYKIASDHSGTGTRQITAAADRPSYILVEDITGSSQAYQASAVPVGVLGYSEITNDVASPINVETILPMSVNISVPAGRTIRIRAQLTFLNSGSSSQNWYAIKEGATVLKFALLNFPLATNQVSLTNEVILSPSAGAHTYTVGVQSNSGTMTVSGAADRRSFMVVEDITPTPAPASGAPGSTLGYGAQSTALTAFSADTDLPGSSVTVTVPAGRRIKITGKVTLSNPTVANAEWVMWIKEDGVAKQLGLRRNPNIGDTFDILAEHVMTPTAGAHTYKLSVQRTAGTGTADSSIATDRAGFILVEDITGAIWPTGVPVTAGMVASEAWTPFTPTLTQSGAVTFTISYAKYLRIGRLIVAEVWLAVTGTGTGAVKVSVGVPVVGVVDNVCGSFHLVDVSAGLNYTGVAYMEGTNTIIGIANAQTAGFGQASFTAALASGDTVRYSIMYEAAS